MQTSSESEQELDNPLSRLVYLAREGVGAPSLGGQFSNFPSGPSDRNSDARSRSLFLSASRVPSSVSRFFLSPIFSFSFGDLDEQIARLVRAAREARLRRYVN